MSEYASWSDRHLEDRICEIDETLVALQREYDKADEDDDTDTVNDIQHEINVLTGERDAMDEELERREAKDNQETIWDGLRL